jgi:hypothetical protein
MNRVVACEIAILLQWAPAAKHFVGSAAAGLFLLVSEESYDTHDGRTYCDDTASWRLWLQQTFGN